MPFPPVQGGLCMFRVDCFWYGQPRRQQRSTLRQCVLFAQQNSSCSVHDFDSRRTQRWSSARQQSMPLSFYLGCVFSACRWRPSVLAGHSPAGTCTCTRTGASQSFCRTARQAHARPIEFWPSTSLVHAGFAGRTLPCWAQRLTAASAPCPTPLQPAAGVWLRGGGCRRCCARARQVPQRQPSDWACSPWHWCSSACARTACGL